MIDQVAGFAVGFAAGAAGVAALWYRTVRARRRRMGERILPFEARGPAKKPSPVAADRAKDYK